MSAYVMVEIEVTDPMALRLRPSNSRMIVVEGAR